MVHDTIDDPFRWWVTKVEADQDPDGLFMIGHDPFPEDAFDSFTDGPRKASFVLISESARMELQMILTVGHKAVMGPGLFANGIEAVPPVPFLLTNELDSRAVWNGTVHLEPTDRAAQIFRRDNFQHQYVVAGEGWHGLLKPFDEAMGNLFAVTINGDPVVMFEQPVIFQEWECPMGSLRKCP
jgi:hypothetical protein